MKKWRGKVVILTAMFALTGICFLVYPLFSPRVYAGVTIEGVAVGGHRQDEVAQLLEVWRKEQQKRKIIVRYGQKYFPLTAENIDLDLDSSAMLNEVWNYGRDGFWWTRLKNIQEAREQGYRVPMRIKYNEDKLARYIEIWKAAVERTPRNATLSILSGEIITQQQGIRLEAAAAEPAVIQGFLAGDETVFLPVIPVQPDITVADISRLAIKRPWGVYTTSFQGGDANRVANIRVAVDKINGTVISPGETFSFNDIVGPREISRGFKPAPELVNGELVPGVGGGICQVSSTLYNAALLSDLPVIERHNHSKPLGYVPLGRDATVVFGVLDFKFINDTLAPIMIVAEVQEDKLCVGILGKTKLDKSVELVSAQKKTIPPPELKREDDQLYLGETEVENPGKPGYEITIMRVVRHKGQELRRETVSKDNYLPENKIIKIGTQLPPFAKKANGG
ncbi:hypothetical protein P22_3874 [Propionispora sp. 2/2-37]|uniref:VanW family protein n=1 Tax=Propionispora sp. 2/2-37 TaxID=1677858 RepID=UPI0006BB6DD7|nr:VanW family protein [Propionispora sp. 2/2-37]CUH97730.1 hypothetical protein P22_3874 [Propionispora sp. 2/2-37]